MPKLQFEMGQGLLQVQHQGAMQKWHLREVVGYAEGFLKRLRALSIDSFSLIVITSMSLSNGVQKYDA